MEKFDWVLQPPLAEKFTFLVDNLNEYGTYGYTTDLDKLNYNRRLIGVEFNLDLGINSALATKGVATVVALGRFITVIAFSRDEESGRMIFSDFRIDRPVDELRELLLSQFNPEVTEQWLSIHSRLRSGFSSDDDLVALSLV